ncbi:hypothetical protein THRCLA_11937, partial [Thraustotheca clavata]
NTLESKWERLKECEIGKWLQSKRGMASTGANNKLNRELLRWLQSLDLAYSLKNIKRDFSNGFLIAEILSRYYDKDISMHSFDNGIGLKVKKDNWDQLLKFMAKLADFEPLGGKQEADAVMHCENGAAVAYLGKLYQCLTKRELQQIHPRPIEEDIPPYAKPTGSALIREKMRGPEFVETTDELQIGQKVRNVHARHEESLQLERLTDLERYGPPSNEAKMVRPRKQKVVGEEFPVITQAVVKEVQIKSIDDRNLNLAQLRATREATAALTVNSNGSEYGYGVELDGVDLSEKNGPKRRLMDLLNEYIVRKLTGTAIVTQMDARKDRFDAFIHLVLSGGVISDDDVADVLRDLVDPGSVLANVLLDSAKDFWKFTGMLHPFLNDFGEENPIFVATVELWTTLGALCTKRDAAAAAIALSDNTLPRLAAILNSSPKKRHAILRIIYSFGSTKVVAHIQVIKRLREILPSMTVFVHCLSLLFGMETELDDTLADLYYYYCCIGLDQPCEKLRAACIGMIPQFLVSTPHFALDLVPRLLAFSVRSAWWEVKAQMLIVVTTLLEYLAQTTQSVDGHIDTCLSILEREFSPNCAFNLRQLGLVHELVPNYVDVLRSLPVSMLHDLIVQDNSQEGHNAVLPICGSSGAIYHLNPLRSVWDVVSISKQIYLDFQEHLSKPTEGSMVIQHSCFDELARSQPELLNSLYLQLQPMILSSLEMSQTCELGVAILSTVSFYSSPYLDVLKSDAMSLTMSAEEAFKAIGPMKEHMTMSPCVVEKDDSIKSSNANCNIFSSRSPSTKYILTNDTIQTYARHLLSGTSREARKAVEEFNKLANSGDTETLDYLTANGCIPALVHCVIRDQNLDENSMALDTLFKCYVYISIYRQNTPNIASGIANSIVNSTIPLERRNALRILMSFAYAHEYPKGQVPNPTLLTHVFAYLCDVIRNLWSPPAPEAVTEALDTIVYLVNVPQYRVPICNVLMQFIVKKCSQSVASGDSTGSDSSTRKRRSSILLADFVPSTPSSLVECGIGLFKRLVGSHTEDDILRNGINGLILLIAKGSEAQRSSVAEIIEQLSYSDDESNKDVQTALQLLIKALVGLIADSNGDDNQKIRSILYKSFYLSSSPSRVVLNAISSGDERFSMVLSTSDWMWTKSRPFACISTLVHGPYELELFGMLDGSIQIDLINQEERQVLFRYPVAAPGDRIMQVVLLPAEIHCVDIVVLLKSGKLIAVEGIDVDDLVSQPPPSVAQLFTKVCFRVANVGANTQNKEGIEPSLMKLVRNENGSLIVFIANHGQNKISKWTAISHQVSNALTHTFVNEGCLSSTGTAGFPIHLQLSPDKQILVVITAKAISWWDANTLVLIYCYDNSSVAILAACSQAPWKVGVVSCADNCSTMEIKVLSLKYAGPFRSTIQSTSCLKLPNAKLSVALTFHGNEILFFSASDSIQAHRIYTPSEPEMPEGNLPLESSPFHEMCDDMQSSDHIYSSKDFELAIWAYLQEHPQAVNTCLTMTFPRDEDMSLLFDAIERWCQDEQDGLSSPTTLATVTAVQYKWITFQLLCAPDSEPISMTSWSEFRNASLIDVLLVLISQGSIARLQILWRRHVSKDMLEAFSLQLLPLDIPASALRPWFFEDVIAAHQRFRVSLNGLTASVAARATLIAEQGDTEEALEWTAMLRPNRIPNERLWKQSQHQGEGPHHDLRVLDLQLQRLLYLSKVHSFHLSLQTFRMATMEGIAMSMLDRIFVPNMIPVEIECHIQPYLELCDEITLESVLTEYISEKAHSNQLQQTTEEHRCRVLLPYIKTLEKRAQATLSYLQAIHAPYNAEVIAIAKEASQWQSAKQVELQEQLRMMELQGICIAYGLTQFHATNPYIAYRLCQYVCCQVDRPTALKDALQLASAFPNMRPTNVIMNYCQNLISTKWTEVRLKSVLDALEATEIRNTWSFAVELIGSGLIFLENREKQDEKECVGDLHEYLLSLVSTLLTKYERSEEKSVNFERAVNQELRRDLRKMHTIFSDFGIILSLKSYRSKEMQSKVLKVQLEPWIKYLTVPAPSLKRKRMTVAIVAPKSTEELKKANTALSSSQRLSSLLGLSTNKYRSFLASQAAQVGNVDEVVRFARRSDPQQLKDIAIALICRMKSSRDSRQWASIDLAYELLVLAVLENSNMMESWSELKMVALLRHVYRYTQDQVHLRDLEFQRLQSWRLYDDWYRDSSVVLQPSVLPLTVQFIDALINNNDEEQAAMFSTPLVTYLVDNQAHQLTLKVLLNMPSIPKELFWAFEQQLDQMLSIIFHAPKIDRDLALAYMLSMKQQSAYSAFKKQIVRENVYKDFARLQQLARIGADAARNWQQIAFLNQCNELENNAKWWHHLNLLGISCEHRAFQSERRDMKVLQSIVPRLLKATSLDLYCVLEFTRQYNIPDSYPCLHYVKALLLEPSCEDYASRIVGVLEDVHQSELTKMLVNLFGDIPTTDYARIQFVLDLLLQLKHEQPDKIRHRIAILDFLQHYTPKLPFHALINDTWAVLEPELSLTSVIQLVSLSVPLDLEPDEMYMRLIKKLVVENTTNSSVTLPFEKFASVLGHLSSIKNMVSTAEWISNKYKAPFRANTIAALEFAISLAESNTADVNEQKDESGVKFLGTEATARLKLRLLLIQTEQCWIDIGVHFTMEREPIPCPTYSTAQELIEMLYNEYALLAQKQMSPLVNQMAAKIAALHGQSISTIRRDIILRTLKKPKEIVDVSKLSVWQKFQSHDDKMENSLVTQLVYIGSDEKLDTTCQTLWLFASATATRTAMNYRAKYRALKLLIKLLEILDTPLDFVLPDVSESHLSDTLKHLEHLTKFDDLRLPQVFDQFVRCDKSSLIRGLWRQYRGNPSILKLLSGLMLAYDITEASLWEVILQQMIVLEMFPLLFQLLRPMSKISIAQDSSINMVDLYNQVLIWPLQQIQLQNQMENGSDIVKCIVQSIVLTLQQCVFLQRLDVIAIVQLLCQLDQVHKGFGFDEFAIECAMTIPQQRQRQQVFEQLLLECDGYYIIVVLRVLFRVPFQRLEPGHVRFLQWIAQYIVNHDQCQFVLESPDIATTYCSFITTHNATREAMDQVIATLLHQNRMGDANHVVEMYLEHGGISNDQGLPLEWYLQQTESPLLVGFRNEMLED